MHIVVEGMDGSGKTTLVEYLADALPHLPVARRSTPSVGGPPADLDAWVEASFDLPPSIFDRHAVISEPVYGPICRGTMPGNFNNALWLAAVRARLASEAIVVFCEPPWSTVHRNLAGTEHMAGVVDHAYELYQQYHRVQKMWRGPIVVHDYTQANASRTVHIVTSLWRGLGR